MTYTVSRVWYGGHGYQWAWFYESSTAPADAPCIAYLPGGGWKGAQREAWEVEAIWSQGLSNEDSAYTGDYHVFVPNCASVGYTGQLITANTSWATATGYVVGDIRSHDVATAAIAWATGTDYAVGNRVTERGHRFLCTAINGPATTRYQPLITPGWEGFWSEYSGRYQCRDDHTSGASTEPGVGASWTTVWHKMGKGFPGWVVTTAYLPGEYVSNGGDYWQCIQGHTAAAGDEPGVGAGSPPWEEVWREVGPNEPGFKQQIDVVETTPGFLDQSVTDAQRFMLWLKRNAATYSIDANKICLAGSSAGGQRAGCAAYQYDLPYAYDGAPYAANVEQGLESSRPRALYLSITPTDWRDHTIYGLANGLYGRDFTDVQFAALEDVEKDAVSPNRILKRTGLSCPTYLNYASGGYHGDGNSPPWANGTWIYHHADNGWLLLDTLTTARPTGFARTDCRHIEADPAGGYRKYTSYSGAAVNIGTTAKDVADDFFVWAASVLT